MLRVTLEYVPYGIEENKKKIGVLEIANTGEGTVELGSYRIDLTTGSGSVVAKDVGWLDNWPRGRSAWQLVQAALGQLVLTKRAIR